MESGSSTTVLLSWVVRQTPTVSKPNVFECTTNALNIPARDLRFEDQSVLNGGRVAERTPLSELQTRQTELLIRFHRPLVEVHRVRAVFFMIKNQKAVDKEKYRTGSSIEKRWLPPFQPSTRNPNNR